MRQMKEDLLQVSESMTSLQQLGAKDDLDGPEVASPTLEVRHASPWLEKI